MVVALLELFKSGLELHDDVFVAIYLLTHLGLFALRLLELQMEGLYIALDLFDSFDDLFLEYFLPMLNLRRTLKSSGCWLLVRFHEIVLESSGISGARRGS